MTELENDMPPTLLIKEEYLLDRDQNSTPQTQPRFSKSAFTSPQTTRASHTMTTKRSSTLSNTQRETARKRILQIAREAREKTMDNRQQSEKFTPIMASPTPRVPRNKSCYFSREEDPKESHPDIFFNYKKLNNSVKYQNFKLHSSSLLETGESSSEDEGGEGLSIGLSTLSLHSNGSMTNLRSLSSNLEDRCAPSSSGPLDYRNITSKKSLTQLPKPVFGMKKRNSTSSVTFAEGNDHSSANPSPAFQKRTMFSELSSQELKCLISGSPQTSTLRPPMQPMTANKQT